MSTTLVRVVAVGLTLLTGCKSSSPNASAGEGPEGAVMEAGARERDVLTQFEINERAANATDVYDALFKLRPHFIRVRGARVRTDMQGATNTRRVYINDTHAGSVEVLKNLRVAAIREVRLLSASEATMRYGTNNVDGAIVVILQ